MSFVRRLTTVTRFSRVLFALAVVASALAISAAAGLFKHAPKPAPRFDFESQMQPLLKEYCFDCHNETKHRGGLSLVKYSNLESIRNDQKTWAQVLRKLQTQEMPPEGKRQPTTEERTRLMGWVESEVFPVDCDHPDPGRVTIRRLNRVEYNNTIRDLLGVDFAPADDFPNDDTGYGFDNIGDVLSLSPLLLEKYLAAAEQVVSAAMAKTNSRSSLLIIPPTPGAATNEALRHILGPFANKAFRRPVTAAETERLIKLAEANLSAGVIYRDAVKTALEAILLSPHFLFRGELQPDPNDASQVHPIDEYALASRLSYFLWSTMPDDKLFALAAKGQLRKNLRQQVARMLKSPKAAALADNFAGQWLQLRNLKEIAPDHGTFPEFDEELRAAMAEETRLFFTHIVSEDRSVLEFITADYTYANERLSRHYGLQPPLAGPTFRKVSLRGTGRAGVLTHGSVLAVTSNPTRTSPVKRGKWVLENLLNQAPPPPPPGTPPLKEAQEDGSVKTLRERMVQHRADPTCSSCHTQMDPIGFSLEHFDGIGAWRERDGSAAIDASGQLPDGQRFSGAVELQKVLAGTRKEQFLRCLSEKMLTYALGRGLEYYDRCAVDKIVMRLKKGGHKFSALVEGIVESVPFQQRRGEGAEP